MEKHEIETAAPLRELPGSYVDLPAVFGGAVVSAALVGLFTTFGGAIGLSTLSAERGESSSFNTWMIITALWLLLTIVLSFGAGGYLTGRLRRRLDRADADEIAARDGLNGLIVWGLGTLVAGWMLASVIGGAVSVAGNVAGTAVSAAGSAVGGVVSGTGQALGGAVSATGSAVGGTLQAAGSALGGVAQGLGGAAAGAAQASNSAQGSDDGVMNYITDSLLRPALNGASAATQSQTGVATPTRPALDDAELSRQIGVILGNVLRTGEISDADKDFMVAATAQRTNLSQAEVEERVNAAVTQVQETRAEASRLAEEAKAEAERLYTETKAEAERVATEAKAEADRLIEEAKQQAIDAAETVRKNAILTSFLLTAAALLAAAAALIGGVIGGRHRDAGRIFAGFRYR